MPTVRPAPRADRPSLPALLRLGTQPAETVELLDYVEDVMLWIKDAHGYYAWANRAFLINFGLKERSDLPGKTDFDTCCAPMADQYRIDDELVLSGHRIINRIELIPRFDYTARWCSTSKIPVHDAQGKIVGSAGISSPIDSSRVSTFGGSGVSPAIHYVRQHLAEPLTNRKLAQVCNLSVRSFERQFRATYHCSPHDYIREVRVRMSCAELLASKKTVVDIACEFGFSDQSHFSKEFRRVMGDTPHAYRRRLGVAQK